MSAALDILWGGTGSRAVGAEPFTTLTPTWLAAKGFGFLPESMKFLRPFGVTTQLGYLFPTESSTTAFDEGSGLAPSTRNPQFLICGGSLQYSMPYLKSRVQDLVLPDVLNHLVPLVELNLRTQTSNFGGERTTGTINPGMVYIGDKSQLSIEAMIPVNRASGDGVGVIAQLDVFLDDAFPHSPLFRPLFSTASSKPDQCSRLLASRKRCAQPSSQTIAILPTLATKFPCENAKARSGEVARPGSSTRMERRHR